MLTDFENSFTVGNSNKLYTKEIQYFLPPHSHRCALHQLHYQLHSVEGRTKCPTVPQLCGLMTGTRIAGQGSK